MKRATILLLLALPFWAAAQSPKGGNASQSAEYQKLKFEQFFDYLNARYVDTLNNETLVEEAITGILSALDPHSSYSSAEEMKASRNPSTGVSAASAWNSTSSTIPSSS